MSFTPAGEQRSGIDGASLHPRETHFPGPSWPRLCSPRQAALKQIPTPCSYGNKEVGTGGDRLMGGGEMGQHHRDWGP